MNKEDLQAELSYDVERGYGIRVKKHEASEGRPAGYVVEIHFYNQSEAVKYASALIRAAQVLTSHT